MLIGANHYIYRRTKKATHFELHIQLFEHHSSLRSSLIPNRGFLYILIEPEAKKDLDDNDADHQVRDLQLEPPIWSLSILQTTAVWKWGEASPYGIGVMLSQASNTEE